jgi:hypothetical protein
LTSTASRTTGAVLVFFAATLAGDLARAEPSATAARVQLALLDPLQWVDEDRSVRGLRFSLLRGANRDVSGFDLSGVATRTLGSLRGLQIAAANEVDGDGTGVQVGFFVSHVEGAFSGLQLSGLATHAGKGTGVQLAAFSDATVWKGLQLGLVNRAREMEGLQVGLLNFNERGFLPVFPLFNFGR